MTEVEIAKRLLRGARRRIEYSEHGLICPALMSAAGNRDRRRIAVSFALQRWVSRMLGGRSTYGSWVRDTHPTLFLPAYKNGTLRAKLQEGRLAWIDWMLTQDLDAIVRGEL